MPNRRLPRERENRVLFLRTRLVDTDQLWRDVRILERPESVHGKTVVPCGVLRRFLNISKLIRIAKYKIRNTTCIGIATGKLILFYALS